MLRKLGLAAAMLAVVVIAASGYSPGLGAGSGAGPTIPGGITLIRPAIAQTASFLDQEAGMSAYVDTGFAINLSNARNAFRTVERENSDWLIGSVPVPGHTEAEDAHVFVHQSGWIVAYYERGSPVARTVHWNGHPTPGPHKIVQALTQVAASAGVPASGHGFFNFEFPNATEWLLIFDDNEFSLNIPSQFLVFERSFSHFTTVVGDVCRFAGPSVLKIDVVSLSATCTAGMRYGLVSAIVLSVDTTHDVSVSSVSGFNGTSIQGSAAISLLYLPAP